LKDEGNTMNILTVHVTIYMAVCGYNSNPAFPRLNKKIFMIMKYCNWIEKYLTLTVGDKIF